MRVYVVRQGDYVAKIAHRFGVTPEELWGLPENEDLSRSRGPNVLRPGDVLHVPDEDPEPLPLDLGGSNAYVADIPEIAVRMTLRVYQAPLKDEPFVVEGAGEPYEDRSDPETGEVEIRVPVDVEEIRIALPERGIALPVLVGHLDPVDTPAGVRERLRGLGFYDPCLVEYTQREMGVPIAGSDEESRLAWAVASFRAAGGVTPSGPSDDRAGLLDEATRKALVDAYGC